MVLVGPMGSGKSAVGRALANRLERSHIDLDDAVVQAAERSIPEVFESEGEAGFRTREADALVGALAAAPSVISTGGGVVTTGANRSMLADDRSLVVWLDADLDTLVRRVGDGRGRPLLGDDVRAKLAATVADREPLYSEVADVRIDTTDARRSVVVERVLAALAQEVPT